MIDFKEVVKNMQKELTILNYEIENENLTKEQIKEKICKIIEG